MILYFSILLIFCTLLCITDASKATKVEEVTLGQNPSAKPSFYISSFLTCHTVSVVLAPVCAFSAENSEKCVMQLGKLLGYSSFELDTVFTGLEVAACGFEGEYFLTGYL